MAGTTALILHAAKKGNTAAAELILFRQLAATSLAIMKAHKASGDARRAAEISSTLRGQLAQVRDGYQTQITVDAALAQEQAWAALPPELKDARRLTEASFGTGSPVPTKLSPQEQRDKDLLALRARQARTQPDNDRGDRGL